MDLGWLALVGALLLAGGAGILFWERRRHATQPALPSQAAPGDITTNLLGEDDARNILANQATVRNPGWTSLAKTLNRQKQTQQGMASTAPRSKLSRAVPLVAGSALAAFACALVAAFTLGRGSEAAGSGSITVGFAQIRIEPSSPQPAVALADYVARASSAQGYTGVALRLSESQPTNEDEAERERERLGADFLLWGEVGADGGITANVTLAPHFRVGQRQWQNYTEKDAGALIFPRHARLSIPARVGTDPLVPLSTALIGIRAGDYRGAALTARGAQATIDDVGGTGQFARFLEASAEAASGNPKRALELFDIIERADALSPEGSVNRAIARLMNSDYAGAITDAEMLLGDREAPNSVLARAYLVRARARFGLGSQYSGALSDLDEAKRLDPRYPFYRLDRAEILYRQAQPDTARAEIESLTRDLWDAAPAHRLMGMVRLMLGQPDEAHVPLARSEELYNAWIAELRGVETAAQVSGDAQRAQDATEGILQLNRELAGVHLYRGMAWADKARGEPEESFLGGVWRNIRGEPTTYERAIRSMEEAARLDANRADVPMQIGNVYVQMGDTGRGADALARAMSLDPSAPEPYLALARLQEAQGNVGEAVKTISNLVGNTVGFYPAYEELYRLYGKVGDGQAARDTLVRALQFVPRTPGDHLWRGKFMRELGMTDEAIAEFSAALNDPELWEAHRHLGELWERKGQMPQALSEYQAALASQPNDPRALLGAGRLLVLAGEIGEAEKLFARLTGLAPQNVEGHIAYLQLLMQKGDVAAAIRQGEQAVAADGSRSDGHFFLGIAHEAGRDWGAAIEQFRATVERDPNHFEALIRMARALVMSDRHAEAIEVCRQAIALRSDDPQPYRWLAEAQVATGDAAGALQSLSKSLELQPNRADALALAARAYLLGGDTNTALDFANRAVQADPRDPAGHMALGESLMAQGRHAESAAAYDAALQIAAGNPEVLVGKGRALAGAGDHAGAITTFGQALASDPKSAEAYLNSGRSYEALGNLDEAWKRYARAVELRPNWADALVQLGRAQMLKQDWEGALRSYDKATKAASGSAAAWQGLGMSLRQRGSLDDAIEALSQAVKIESRNSEAWLNLGLTLEERGKRGEASHAFTQAHETATSDVVRRQAENGLERVK